MEQYAEQNQKCRIILTQPRRIAATSVAQRISDERNDVHGNSVGHQIRMESCVRPTTNLTLTTRFVFNCFNVIYSVKLFPFTRII